MEKDKRTIKIKYMIMDADTSYNMLLGRPSLNRLGAIMSTLHLTMKFPVENNKIARVWVHQQRARECYVTSLRILPWYQLRKKELNTIARSNDFDPRPHDEPRVEPRDETVACQLGGPRQDTKINVNLNEEDKRKITQMLVDNRDLFAWTTTDMSGIDLDIMSHRLAFCPGARLISQRKSRLGEERRMATQWKVDKL